MLCGQGNVNKMKHIQFKALHFVFNDFTSSYAELQNITEQPSISIHLIRSLTIEVHKCIHEIAPEYLCTLLTKHNIPYDLTDDNRLAKKKILTISYGKRSFVYLGAKLWNIMSLEIKNAISLQYFKDRLKTWDGPCDCSKWN